MMNPTILREMPRRISGTQPTINGVPYTAIYELEGTAGHFYFHDTLLVAGPMLWADLLGRRALRKLQGFARQERLSLTKIFAYSEVSDE